MTTEDVSDFLTRVLKEQDFDFYNPDEVIYWYCYSTQQGYHKAEELKKNMRYSLLWKWKILRFYTEATCALIRRRN